MRYGERTRPASPVKYYNPSVVRQRTDRNNASYVWTRPADWLSLTTPSTGEQKIVVLAAVYNAANNFFAVTCSGNYNVNWGDGTNTNYTAGTKAEKDFAWASYGAGTLTSRGYRQAIVTITPQAGQNLTSINFSQRHTSDPRTSTNSTSAILEVRASTPNATSFTFGSTASVRHVLLEQFLWVGSCAVTSYSQLFANCQSLDSLSMPTNTAVTTTASMFDQCISLQNAPELNLSSVTSTDSMFNGCSSLQYVPDYNMPLVTDVDRMFQQCFSLKNAPTLNLPSITTAISLFSQCTSLVNVPPITFPTSGAGWQGPQMFNSCRSLEVAPIMNLEKLTYADATFSGCYNLRKVPSYRFASITGSNALTNFFGACYLLEEIPPMDFSGSTSMGSIFNGTNQVRRIGQITTSSSMTDLTTTFVGCNSLEVAPVITNTQNVTSTQSMYSQCTSLRFSPDMHLPAVTTVSGMFSGCQVLEVAPQLTGLGNACTTFASIFANCTTLRSVPAYDFSKATSFASAFSNCGKLVSLPTITVTAASTNTQSMFGGCSSLKEINVTIPNCTNTQLMFSNCFLLEKIVGTLNTSNATAFGGMFSNCYSLSTLPTVTGTGGNRSSWFQFASNCFSLRTVPSSWRFPSNVDFSNGALNATELNQIYTNLPNRNAKTITGVTRNGTYVTYTCNAAHGLIPGMQITMTGINPTAFNLSFVYIFDTPTATTFRIASTAAGTYVSGGTATPATLTITVSNNPGAATDTPATATGKGWTVTG